MPRKTLMIYREQGYVSEPARELIRIVHAFNWHDPAALPVVPVAALKAATGPRRVARAVRRA